MYKIRMMTETNATCSTFLQRSSGLSCPLAISLFILTLASCGCVTPWERGLLARGGRSWTERGPLERKLWNYIDGIDPNDELYDSTGRLRPAIGSEDFDVAQASFERGDFQLAEKQFHAFVKNRRYRYSELREDALFLEAESAYKQERYADAGDLYTKLLKEFETTSHLDTATQRMFDISRRWLDAPVVAEMSEIKQVNFDNPHEKLPSPEPVKARSQWTILPNFTDAKRPLYDAEGNALGLLKQIWLHDPTGPLADDAIMLTASYYARTGRFVDADHHYTMLREQYPNSPHIQAAFVLGSHVKLMSYDGPGYDEKTLYEAQQLKESTLQLFPNVQDRERIQAELKKIEESKAGIIWADAIVYERKSKPRAAAIQCHTLISKYPQSTHAAMAREMLARLGPEYASGAAFLSSAPDAKPTISDIVLGRTPRPNLSYMPPPVLPEDAESATGKPKRVQENGREERPARPIPRLVEPAPEEEMPTVPEDDEGKKRKSILPIPAPRRLPDDAEVEAKPTSRRWWGGKKEGSDSGGHSEPPK